MTNVYKYIYFSLIVYSVTQCDKTAATLLHLDEMNHLESSRALWWGVYTLITDRLVMQEGSTLYY